MFGHILERTVWKKHYCIVLKKITKNPSEKIKIQDTLVK